MRILRYALVTVVFALAVYVLAHNTDVNRLRAVFLYADWRMAAAGLMFAMAVFIVKAYRWQVILAPVKKVPCREAFGILSVSQLITNVLPFRAGDLAQVVTMGERQHINKASVLTTIAAYHLIDLAAMAAAIVAVSFAAFVPPGIGRAALAVLGLSVTVGTIAFFFGGKLVDSVVDHFPLLGNRLRPLAAGARVFVQARVLTVTLGLTLIMWVFGFLQAWCTLAAFGIHLSFWGIIGYMVLPSIVTIIPSTPGFFGVWDAASVGILLQFGIAKEPAIGATLVSRAMGLTVVSLGSVIGLLMNIVPVREVKKCP